MDEGGGGGKADSEPFLASGQAEPQSDVGLAGTAGTKGDDILAPLDPLTPRQLEHPHLVEAGDSFEVKAVETFDRREAGRLDPPFNRPPLTIDQLQFDQPGKELDMIQPLGGALAGELAIFPQEGRQLQRLEVMVEKKLGRLAHDAPPAIRLM